MVALRASILHNTYIACFIGVFPVLVLCFTRYLVCPLHSYVLLLQLRRAYRPALFLNAEH